MDILPRPFPYSFPNVTSRSIKHVESIADIHNYISTDLLPKLHYCQHIRVHLQVWGRVQRHADGSLDLAPGQATSNMHDSKAVQMVLKRDREELAFADVRAWQSVAITQDELKPRSELGVKNWVWRNDTLDKPKDKELSPLP